MGTSVAELRKRCDESIDHMNRITENRPGWDEPSNVWRQARLAIVAYIQALEVGREGQGPCWT